MKHDTGRDLKKLRWHLLAVAALLAAAALLALWSRSIEGEARRDMDAAAARFRQTESRLRQVRTEEQEIKEKSALFLRLSRNGIIGDEQRLEWTEMLRDVQRQLRLPEMSYEFAPQALLEGGTNGDYAFLASPMKIHLQLVHEYDLINFLDLVQRQARALVVTRSCALGRSTPSPSAAGRGQLSADCELEWITARSPAPR